MAGPNADSYTVLRCLTDCNTFFTECEACRVQHSGKELQTKYFDLDDVHPTGICSRCLTGRKYGHRYVQIRRSSHCDVVCVTEIGRYINVMSVQTYSINSRRVVFLKRRPSKKSLKACPGATTCCNCLRPLADSVKYCSLQCKIDWEEGGSSAEKSFGAPLEGYALPHLVESSSSEDCWEGASNASSATVQRRKGVPRRAAF